MPLFIKTENFTSETLSLSQEKRKPYIKAHCNWIKKLRNNGLKVSSGYLVDSNKKPGGGGLLFLEADSLSKAEQIIKGDPLIVANLVQWKIQEWIPIDSESILLSTEGTQQLGA